MHIFKIAGVLSKDLVLKIHHDASRGSEGYRADEGMRAAALRSKVAHARFSAASSEVERAALAGG